MSPQAFAAITCQDSAKAAIEGLQPALVGIQRPCCSRTTTKCRADLNECNADFPDLATCFSVDGSIACQLRNSTLSGSPCGAVYGAVGAPDISPVLGQNLTFSGLSTTLKQNWGPSGADISHVTCCSPSSGACYLADYLKDLINPCHDGDYEILCAGDAQQGLCSVYDNKHATMPLNAFFRVNFAQAATPSNLTADATTTGTTNGTSQPQVKEAVVKHGVNALFIALPIALVIIVLAAVQVFCRHRRGRSKAKTAETPLPLNLTPSQSRASAVDSTYSVHVINPRPLSFYPPRSASDDPSAPRRLSFMPFARKAPPAAAPVEQPTADPRPAPPSSAD